MGGEVPAAGLGQGSPWESGKRVGPSLRAKAGASSRTQRLVQSSARWESGLSPVTWEGLGLQQGQGPLELRNQ